jgi:hypothetical protein
MKGEERASGGPVLERAGLAWYTGDRKVLGPTCCPHRLPTQRRQQKLTCSSYFLPSIQTSQDGYDTHHPLSFHLLALGHLLVRAVLHVGTPPPNELARVCHVDPVGVDVDKDQARPEPAQVQGQAQA